MRQVLFAMSLCWSLAFAGHTGELGTTEFLEGEAHELNMVVQYSTLNYSVKRTVADFAWQVRTLHQCAEINGGPAKDEKGDETEDNHTGIPAECEYESNRVQWLFRNVERYLWDTQFDYPQVYFQYLEVKRALSTLHNEEPLHPEPFSCVAVDADWETHSGGHVGYGADSFTAKRNALRECQRYHFQCCIHSCR